MREAYQIASKRAVSSQERSKQAYDKRVRHTILEPGGRVLVRNLRERGGPGKLRSFWENRLYKVLKRMGEDSPVYQVSPESVPNATPRVLHRNLMLPSDDFPLEQPLQKQRRETYIQQEKPCSTDAKDSDIEDNELILYVEPTTELPGASVETDRELPEAAVETDRDDGHIGPNEPAIGSTEDLDSSLASTEAPSPLPLHPQRIRKQREVLQYTKFGQPSSFPVCNIVQVPQRLVYFYYPSQFQPRLSHIMPVLVPFAY